MFLKVVALLLEVSAVANAVLVGAPVIIDMSNPGAQEALQFAVDQINAMSDSPLISHVDNVISVEMQVVAGIKYIFNVQMAQTCCRDMETENACAVNSDPALHECRLAVWIKPGQTCMNLVENTC